MRKLPPPPLRRKLWLRGGVEVDYMLPVVLTTSDGKIDTPALLAHFCLWPQYSSSY